MKQSSFGQMGLRSTLTALIASTVVALGIQEVSPASAVPTLTPSVAIGSSHVVALGSDGSIWTWGSLTPGPTGVGSRYALNRPTEVALPAGRTAVSVAATNFASFAAANDGTVWAWGSLGRGLGDVARSTDVGYDAPVQVEFPSNVLIAELSAACDGLMARSTTGDVYQWGSFYGNWNMSYAAPTRLAEVSGATSITRGCNASFAIRSNGTAFAWGSNGGGRLGDGTTTDRSNPVVISLPDSRQFSLIRSASSHTLALATDGTVWAWGGNSQGQLARDPNSVSYSANPLRIDIGSTSAIWVLVSDSTPFSSVVTTTGAVTRWGGWGQNEFRPGPMNLPTTDLGSRKLIRGASLNSTSIFVADDNSLWSKGGWSTTDLDGNCGANASDWQNWVNGAIVPARPLVRVLSGGQFGTAYAEDTLSIAKFETGTGGSLPLDGSGTASGTVGNLVTLVATSPQSACYQTSQLSYQFSDDNGATWTSSGISVSTNSFAQTIVTISHTPMSSGRKRAQFRLLNPDNRTTTFRLTLGVAASASSGNESPSAAVLPIVATVSTSQMSNIKTVVAVGTDGFLYGWGEDLTILAATSRVVEPKRLFPAATSDAGLQFKSVAIGMRPSDYSLVATAVSTDGRLFVWGKGTNDYLTGGTTDISAPTELPMPGGQLASRVMLHQDGVCYPAMLFGTVLTATGSVYFWGGSPTFASPQLAVGLTGLQISSVKVGRNWNYPLEIRTSTGDLYRWTLAKSLCSGTGPMYDGSRTPEQFGLAEPLSTQYSLGTLYTRDRSLQGIFEITQDNRIKFTELSNLTSGSTTYMSLPGGRIPARLVGPQTFVATDGTVWGLWSKDYNPEQVDIPVELLPIARSAAPNGETSNFLVGSNGALIFQPSDRIPAGTCAYFDDWRYGQRSAWRVTSTGQFGSSFQEDSFFATIDSPRQTAFIDTRSGGSTSYEMVAPPRIISGAGRSIDLRPNTSTELYAYFKSSCVGTTDLSASWDLDNDGVFETSSTVTDVTPDTTSLTTPRPSTDPLGESTGTLDGYKQAKVTVNANSLGGSLSTGGGRMIGLRLSSSRGTSTEQIALIVRPKKPEGRIGVTLNAGARFTDTSDVELGVVWPERTTTLIISNDGSFSDAQEVPVSSSVRWQLPNTGSGLLSSTVYVRFKSLEVDGTTWSRYEGEINYTDDIVQDLSPPEVSSVAATTGSSSVQSFSIQSSGTVRTSNTTGTALVTLSASDSASGIAAVQVTTDPAVPGPERVFSRSYRITADRPTVAVRAKDNVGHWSEWAYTRISGFTTPSPDAPRTAPSNPSSPADPASPSTPVNETPSSGDTSKTPAAEEEKEPSKSSADESSAKPESNVHDSAKVATPAPLQVATPLVPTMKVSKALSTSALVKLTGTKPPARSTFKVTVSKASSAVCKVQGTTVRSIGRGTCTITVSIKPRTGRPILKTVKVKVVQ